MLSGISVTCFAASYGVTVILELTRLFVRAASRTAVMLGFAAAGLFAHTVFLLYQLQTRWEQGAALIDWFSGCLLLAWILATAYLTSALGRPNSSTGLLLLPTSLVLIAAAYLFPESATGIQWWGLLHGISLVFGIALVVVGFIAGIMYLIQSYRLKHKLPPRSKFWLPSLERLQKINERSLYASILLLGLGLLSGILLNLIQSGQNRGIPWSEPVVMASLVWLIWLLTIVIFSAFYPPSRYGRKIAYMTVGSFLFLGVVLGIMLYFPHAGAGSEGVHEVGNAAATVRGIASGGWMP